MIWIQRELDWFEATIKYQQVIEDLLKKLLMTQTSKEDERENKETDEEFDDYEKETDDFMDIRLIIQQFECVIRVIPINNDA